MPARAILAQRHNDPYSGASDVKHILWTAWHEDDGVLSFEWTIVAVVIVFGIVWAWFNR